ncbi:type VI secretion protein, partial [Saccharopolyspora sp. NPDC050389]
MEAAWPGAHTHTHPAEPPLPTAGTGQRSVVVGGELRLARPDALPIRTDFDADPIRALIGSPVGLNRDEHACVQILARPVTGRRLTHARRIARQAHTASTAGHIAGGILDLVTPGATTRGRSVRDVTSRDPQVTLEHSAANRAIVAKQRGSQYETVIRYAVATLL